MPIQILKQFYFFLKINENQEIQWEMVDAVLVSNTHSLVLLPYLTEMKDFRGKVLTTEPVLRLGK